MNMVSKMFASFVRKFVSSTNGKNDYGLKNVREFCKKVCEFEPWDLEITGSIVKGFAPLYFIAFICLDLITSGDRVKVSSESG